MPDTEPAHPADPHLLQDLLRPLQGQPGALYLRSHPATAPDQSLRLARGTVLSTDTAFGAFYFAWWHSVAGLTRVTLAVRLSGRAEVRIQQDAGRGVTLVLAAEVDGDGTTVTLVPQLEPPGTNGANRLFVEVKALTTCRVLALDWCTDQPPVRQTTLSIGLCTFNQEAYLTRTLTGLTALADRLPALLRIHVVNQGAPFTSAALQALCQHPKIRLTQQRNLGGCGGFTRSMVQEVAQAAPASHHLLMDDDIILDERMIQRALRFLDFAQEDVAIGAAMFDALRPTVVHEAGAWLGKANRIEPYCHEVDLGDPRQLWHFNARVRTDYNAWWFCIVPTKMVRKVGLPAPVFIRGDDFEYGQRLSEAGCATVTLPGLGVWHEPFYAKPTSWQDYYDLRNRLIFGATHPEKVSQLSLAHVVGLIASAALTHNYPSARLRLKAVQDYLAGPEQVFADPEAVHASVMAAAKPDAPERLGPEWSRRPAAPPGPKRPAQMAALVGHMALALLWTGFWPFRGRETVVMDVDATPLNIAGRPFVQTNGMRSYHLRFVPSKRVLWPLIRQTFHIARRYRRERAKVDAGWLAAIPKYRTPEWWQAIFPLDG